MKELIGHYVAYRKLVSPSPAQLLPEDDFRLFAVCARFPHNLSGQVPWQEQQPGVYHCQWGTDRVTVVVAGQLPCESRNAPLHLFSASPELLRFGQSAYQQRSENTSAMLGQLFERFQTEGFAMYTIEDFKRDYIKEHFPLLTQEEQREVLESLPRKVLESLPPKVLESLPLEKRLAGASAKEIRKYLDRLTASRPAAASKQRRKK